MTTKRKSTDLTVPDSNSLAVPPEWEAELAEAADAAVAVEASTSTGNFFSTQGGILSWDGLPAEDNRVAVVILDAILENVRYEGKYDANAPQGPSCFAYGRSEVDMEPHEVVEEPYADKCSECELNKWGSSDDGRGKGCRNIRRLALLPAGDLLPGDQLDNYPESLELESATIGLLKLPVTSVKGYAAYVKRLREVAKRPPWAVYTLVNLVPDPKSQFKVTFTLIGPVPTEELAAVKSRVSEAKSMIDTPYVIFDETTPPPPPPPKATRAGRRNRY